MIYPYIENTTQLYAPCDINGLRRLIEQRRDQALKKLPERQLIHLPLRTEDVQHVLDGLLLLEKEMEGAPSETQLPKV